MTLFYLIILLLPLILYFVKQSNIKEENTNANLSVKGMDGHYYLVKEIVISNDGLSEVSKREYKFNNHEMHLNKVEARDNH